MSEKKRPLKLTIELCKNGYALSVHDSQYGDPQKELILSDMDLLCKVAECIDNKTELPQMLKASGAFTDLIRLSARPLEVSASKTVEISDSSDTDL